MTEKSSPIDFQEVTRIQERAIGEAVGAVLEGQSVLIEAPTGAGKTRIFSRIFEELEKSIGESASFLSMVHRDFLARQAEKEFHKWVKDTPLTTSLAANGVLDQSGRCVYAIVDTVVARQDQLKSYRFGTIDEVHHASDNKTSDYGKVIDKLVRDNPDIQFITATASPRRADQRSLHPVLQQAKRITIGYKELARAGQIKLPITKELAIPAKGGGTLRDVAIAHYRPHKEADPAGITKALRAARTDNHFSEVADLWERHSNGRRTIAYASRISEARAFAEEMQSRGYRIGVVDSAMGREHNAQALEDYGAGKYDMLVSVKMIDEGLDVPATRCCLILRESTTENEYQQMVGRCIRTGSDPAFWDVTPLVLDAGASTMMHGAIERRAEVVDYYQRLERGELAPALTAKPLIAGQVSAASAAAIGDDYTPWRKVNDVPPVLALTDGQGVIFAVESEDIRGQRRYTFAETSEIKGRTQVRLMKDPNGRNMTQVTADALKITESNRVLPARATLLRLEATPSKQGLGSMADDRISDESKLHLSSAIQFAYLASQQRSLTR